MSTRVICNQKHLCGVTHMIFPMGLGSCMHARKHKHTAKCKETCGMCAERGIAQPACISASDAKSTVR